MKKLFKLSVVLVAVLLLTTTFNSCVTTPECETYGYNDVTIKNNTGVPIVVDVTYVGSDYNEERYVHVNSSTTYYRMNSGSLWVWAIDNEYYMDGELWMWEKNTINTRACQIFTYTWTAHKSGEAILEVGWEDSGFIYEKSEYNLPTFEMSKVK